eukprot:g27474.t1
MKKQTWRTSLLVRLRISGCCLQLPIGEEGKTKKGKDPDKPKKPAGGAYGIFVAENRERISAKLPKGSPATAVSKPASAEWKKMSDADKKPYQEWGLCPGDEGRVS